ncbi:MAG: hypothetical protein ACI86M_000544 [Saprospiraceae bacterium]|jgi:hypothetical protein
MYKIWFALIIFGFSIMIDAQHTPTFKIGLSVEMSQTCSLGYG